MEIEKVIHGLHSETRRQILKLLCKGDLTATEIYQKLKFSKPVYRQSVHKSLQSLRDCGLVEKYYSSDKNAICYKVPKKALHIDLENMTLK